MQKSKDSHSRSGLFKRSLHRFYASAQHLKIGVVNYWRHYIRGRDLMRPLFAIWELTYACNLDCSYCDDGEGNSYPRQVARAHPLPLDDTFRMLSRLRGEVPAIYLSGGEPTSHPHFLEILHKISQLGFKPVMLNTNGLLLPRLFKQDPDLFSHIDIIIFSLDAISPETLDRLFQSKPGDGARVLEALDLCLEHARPAGCSIIANCVVTHDTIEDAIDVVRLCRERDIMFTPVPANRGKGLMHNFKDLPNYRALVEEIFAPNGLRLFSDPQVFQILMRFLPFECHPTIRPHITPDGKIPWPCQSDQQFALPILEYPSISALMAEAQSRLSVQQWGIQCGSPCYLAENACTYLYATRMLSLLWRAIPGFFSSKGQ
jgi:MoaA/NifB/PqqE/SkfB family radical SAM enzyme